MAVPVTPEELFAAEQDLKRFVSVFKSAQGALDASEKVRGALLEHQELLGQIEATQAALATLSAQKVTLGNEVDHLVSLKGDLERTCAEIRATLAGVKV